MRKIMIKLQKKVPQIMACCAMALAIQNMSSTCLFLAYQPDVPSRRD